MSERGRMEWAVRLLREAGGTVLMECVVMLPMYFALLGGLFLVGEIAVNNMRVEMGDSIVTGLAADRIAPAIIPDDAMTYLFQEKISGHGDYEVDSDSGSGNNEVNHFSAKYMGFVSFGLYLPDWVRGWLSLGNVMAEEKHRDKDETGGELDWDSKGRWKDEDGDGIPDPESTPLVFYDTFANPFRAYIVHRMKPADVKDVVVEYNMRTAYNRARTAGDAAQGWDGVMAADMLKTDVFMNVISDDWIFNREASIQESSVPQGNLFGDDIPRVLSKYGQ